jgi:hypothetical protein
MRRLAAAEGRMGEFVPMFLVAGGFIGTLGLIAWLARKTKPSGEDSDSGAFLSTASSIDDDSSSSSSDSSSSSSDSGSSDSGSC